MVTHKAITKFVSSPLFIISSLLSIVLASVMTITSFRSRSLGFFCANSHTTGSIYYKFLAPLVLLYAFITFGVWFARFVNYCFGPKSSISIYYVSGLAVLMLFIIVKSVWYHCSWYGFGDNLQHESGNFALDLKSSTVTISMSGQDYYFSNDLKYTIKNGDPSKYMTYSALGQYAESLNSDDGSPTVDPHLSYVIKLDGRNLPYSDALRDNSDNMAIKIYDIMHYDSGSVLSVHYVQKLIIQRQDRLLFDVSDFVGTNGQYSTLTSSSNPNVELVIDPSVKLVGAPQCLDQSNVGPTTVVVKSIDCPVRLLGPRQYQLSQSAVIDDPINTQPFTIQLEVQR